MTFPVHIPLGDCEDRIVLGSLAPPRCREWRQLCILIPPIRASFSIATDNAITAQLISTVWERELSLNHQPLCEPQLIIAPHPSFSGRMIDASARAQWLSYSYAPLTVIKRAVRWEYACQCSGTSVMPLHGAILNISGTVCCIIGSRSAGKTYLADQLLQSAPDTHMLVDDWCLVNAETGSICPTGDTHLHVRGSNLHGGLRQLSGGSPRLVELCDKDEQSNETRYLLPKATLSHFRVPPAPQVSVLIFVVDPFANSFTISADRQTVEEELTQERRHFWDDSNVGLPDEVVSGLINKWRLLFNSTRQIVLRGHRRIPVSEVVSQLLSRI